MRLITEQDPAVPELRQQLDRLHASVYSQPEFLSHHLSYFWATLCPCIEAHAARNRRCRMLEVGAGRSTLASFLKIQQLRDRVTLTLHDVFPDNRDWMHSQADEVKIGPVPQLTGEYDMVVSSFVLEHMTDPRASLESMWGCLAPGGSLFLICPRYEGFLYLPPACDHLGWPQQALLRLRLSARRLQAALTGRPAFLLLADAAAFHLPFSRDRDAIHLVSWRDLKSFFRMKRSHAVALPINWRTPLRWRDLLTRHGLKRFLVKHFALIACRVQKP